MAAVEPMLCGPLDFPARARATTQTTSAEGALGAQLRSTSARRTRLRCLGEPLREDAGGAHRHHGSPRSGQSVLQLAGLRAAFGRAERGRSSPQQSLAESLFGKGWNSKSQSVSPRPQIEEVDLHDDVRTSCRFLTTSEPLAGWRTTRTAGKDLAFPSATPSPSPSLALPSHVALVFPGKTSHHKGMISSVLTRAQKDLLKRANNFLGYDMQEMSAHGTEGLLARPKFSGPAIFVASMLALEKLRTSQPDVLSRASAACGFGVGHYAALCAADVLTLEDGLRLIQTESEAVEACEAKQHLQLDCIGLDRLEVGRLCAQAIGAVGDGEVCEVEREHFGNGMTISGTEEAVWCFKALADAAGAKTLLVNTAGGVTYTGEEAERSLTRPTMAEFADAVDEAAPRMRPPSMRLWTASTAFHFDVGCNVGDIVEDLKEHDAKHVLWEASVKSMVRAGIEEFYDCGPQKFLKSMVLRIDKRLASKVHHAEARPTTAGGGSPTAAGAHG